MKRMCIIGSVTMALAGGLWLLTGCEEEIAHQKEVEVDDGEVTTRETTVTETPQGNVEIEKKTTIEEPGDGTVKTKTETETIPNPNP